MEEEFVVRESVLTPVADAAPEDATDTHKEMVGWCGGGGRLRLRLGV